VGFVQLAGNRFGLREFACQRKREGGGVLQITAGCRA